MRNRTSLASDGGTAPVEYKIVALRECAASTARVVEPIQAANYWQHNIASAPNFNKEFESLAVLMLNTRGHAKGHQIVSLGTVDSCILHPREIFRAAIISSAHGIVVMHNHPSGDPSPSQEDIRQTLNLVNAGKLLQIQIIDHVIVGSARATGLQPYSSLRELGYF